MADELPVRRVRDPCRWAAWLAGDARHVERGVARIARKDGGGTSVSYAEALDVALCHGWIDGQKRPLDDRFWLQRFTPRTARSRWSKRNRARAEQLIASGEMAPAGLREVERARADGRWEAAYDSHTTATVPPDLQAALDANPAAAAFFAGLEQHQPLRDPLPGPGGAPARDARTPDRELRGHAQRGPHDPPGRPRPSARMTVATSQATATIAATASAAATSIIAGPKVVMWCASMLPASAAGGRGASVRAPIRVREVRSTAAAGQRSQTWSARNPQIGLNW